MLKDLQACSFTCETHHSGGNAKSDGGGRGSSAVQKKLGPRDHSQGLLACVAFVFIVGFDSNGQESGPLIKAPRLKDCRDRILYSFAEYIKD